VIGARGRALAGVLALIAMSGMWVLAGAQPAAAYVCRFGVSSPGAGTVAGTAVVPITGAFEVKQGSADRVLDVTITQSPGPSPAPANRVGDAVGPPGRFNVPVGPLSLNGRYTARVRFRHAGTSLFNCDDGLSSDRRDTDRTADVSFGVSVRAAPPTNVKARFDTGPRTATVTWDKSGDPDIAGYFISRKVGSAAPTTVTRPPDPLSWTDSNLPAGAAMITYSIEAARKGPEPDTTSERSPSVAAGPLEVPAPPTTTSGGPVGTTTTTTPFVLGRPVGSTPTTTSFALGRPVAGTTLPPGAAPGLRFPAGLGGPVSSAPGGDGGGDGGYQPLLPYPPGGTTQDTTEVADSGDQALVGAENGGEGGTGTPQLAYVASGLLSSVVAAHVLWLRKRVGHPASAGTTDTLLPVEPVAFVESSPNGNPQSSRGTTGPFEPPGTVEPPPPDAQPTPATRPPPGAANGGVILVPPRGGTPTPEPAGPSRRRPLQASRSDRCFEAVDPAPAPAPEAGSVEPGADPAIILRPIEPGSS